MKRERTITTQYIRLYRIITLCLFSLFVLFYAYSFGIRSDNWLMKLFASAYVVMLFYWVPRIFRELKLVKQISYDEAFLYVHDKGTDTQIPLERIRDVEIISLDGMYKFHLMDKEAFGPYILCKTSIWYPFNFRKVDKELDHVRYLIRKRKKSAHEEMAIQLPSNTA